MLFLNYNQIEIVPNIIGYLLNLEMLILNHNQIEIVPNIIGNLSNLEKINIIGNKINGIPNILYILRRNRNRSILVDGVYLDLDIVGA